jgi:hypothetical protein
MLPDVSRPQQERLFHIDFRAWFLGRVTRQDLTTRFGLSEAAATRDIALYRSLAKGNLDFDQSTKTYRCAAGYRPLFEHDPRRSLTAISEGIGDDQVGAAVPHVRAEHPLRLNPPRVEVIAAVSRAIAGRQALRIVYQSLTSGRTTRDVLPHALVDTGVRWHVRAFDRRRDRFADFVLTRIEEAARGDAPAAEHEDREADDQWMRFVQLELMPHPGLRNPEPVARDYDMNDGILRVRLRAALCGYALVHWSVDASADHRLDPRRHHLWLRNRAALHGVENLEIAPGYDEAQGLADA